jgi:hypothetical protein
MSRVRELPGGYPALAARLGGLARLRMLDAGYVVRAVSRLAVSLWVPAD